MCRDKIPDSHIFPKEAGGKRENICEKSKSLPKIIRMSNVVHVSMPAALIFAFVHICMIIMCCHADKKTHIVLGIVCEFYLVE